MPNNIAKETNADASNAWLSERMRTIQDLEDTPRPLVIRVARRQLGDEIPTHSHRRGQLLYARCGLMTTDTEQGIWVVPPHRAVWIPSGLAHRVQFLKRTALCNLYLTPEVSTHMPPTCSMVAISPLLAALIREASSYPTLYDESGEQGRLVAVLLDQLASLPQAPIHLPTPSDNRLQRIAQAIQAEPNDTRTLGDWARVVGASSRTLSRHFRAETGMTFGQWRQQARLLCALRMLADQRTVGDVADALGYDSQSAFIHMFRKATGKTPARYFADAPDDE
ncbi:MAG TPA: AraC family transcriptional regulator [Gammaproteobacteria bacterium]|jgi:AraC-like DNA-binding protein/quercetin dioxygenase-like cupin family protein|nr:AraC family transcriptional regulator [Gammaproteobacteria bacterium]